MEFLTKLANDPFKTETIYCLEDKLEASKKAIYPEEITEEEFINWYKYLREGHEKYELPPDQVSTNMSLKFDHILLIFQLEFIILLRTVTMTIPSASPTRIVNQLRLKKSFHSITIFLLRLIPKR